MDDAIAEVLAPFRVRMLATDYFPMRSRRMWNNSGRRTKLPQLLAESDIVILCVPLNSQTEHMIGERELAAMKRASVLINVARGPVVDEAALITALESGSSGWRWTRRH